MPPALRQPYDVAILGSGIVGSMLGAILARNGARVVLLDRAVHPRFAIGESVTSQFLLMLRVLAQRYRVPEIMVLADVHRSTKVISNTFGVKRHFGFMMHTDGQEPDPAHDHLLATPAMMRHAAHLFRQDSDAYLFRVAARYGCDARQGWRLAAIDIDDGGVTLVSDTDELYRARFLVDASGSRSVLADRLDLRERPARLRHRSRSIFTHMVGVRWLDDVLAPGRPRPPLPWHSGTMHHLFAGGWFWMIPFDNHADSGNPLCSVGLTLDERAYPADRAVDPADEFSRHAARFPAVARQLAAARPVREWVSTGRLQYSSTRTVGYRWCLMSHAAGFVDPLFSTGLASSAEVVHALAGRLLAALADDDYSVERFRPVEEVDQRLLDHNDLLVRSAFTAFAHPRLWDAVFRVWATGPVPGLLGLAETLRRAVRTGDHSALDAPPSGPGLLLAGQQAYLDLLDRTAAACEEFARGAVTGDAAADAVVAALDRAGRVPPIGWRGRDRRMLAPRAADPARLLMWTVRDAPPGLRDRKWRVAVELVRSIVSDQSPV